MPSQPISITAISSISPLGGTALEAWKNYRRGKHFFKKARIGEKEEWIAPLAEDVFQEITELRDREAKYQALDNSVLYAILTARKAIRQAGWREENGFGLNIGSSRGATQLFETYHSEFIRKKRTATLTSPTTTLGNIASWVGHDLQSTGPVISHSITCSTALHALINGVAWLRSGMAERFVVGGSEAPLTSFTIAQMRALKIYSSEQQPYPCRALDLEKQKNTMIIGEGAALACLERGIPENSLAVLEGIGYATEPLEHSVSISTDAKCFQRSMKMALGDLAPETIDVVVMHAPGTVKGDISEFKAIEKVFGADLPALTSNKWSIGHTFGASGMLSVEMAILMLRHQTFLPIPYLKSQGTPKPIQRILVNAVGFGGNAVSVLLGRPNQDE